MFRPASILTAALLSVLVGAAFYGANFLSAQNAQRQSLAVRTGDLTLQLAAAQRQHQSTAHDLQLAETQLAQLATPRPATSAETRDAEVQAWLGRVSQLRQLFATTAAATIPECRLLTDEDWLTVARSAAFASDEQRRQALAALRSAAKRRFAGQLGSALRKFQTAHGDTLPGSLLDLAPYLTAPADPSMLDRYAITNNGSPKSIRGGWIIRETTAVDTDYDSRHTVTPGGGYGSSTGPAAWIDDLAPRLRRAQQAYAAANQGAQPTRIAQVAPFIDPPLDPAMLEKLLKAERERPR